MIMKFQVDMSTLPGGSTLFKQMLVDFQGSFDNETSLLLEQLRHLSAQLLGSKSEKVRPESTVEPFPLFDTPDRSSVRMRNLSMKLMTWKSNVVANASWAG